MSEQLGLFSYEPTVPVANFDLTQDCLPGLGFDEVAHLIFVGSQRAVPPPQAREIGVWYREQVATNEIRMWLEYGSYGDEERVGLLSIFKLVSGELSCVAEIRDRNNPDSAACALVASGYENPFQVREWVEEWLSIYTLHYVGGAECTASWDPME